MPGRMLYIVFTEKNNRSMIHIASDIKHFVSIVPGYPVLATGIIEEIERGGDI